MRDGLTYRRTRHTRVRRQYAAAAIAAAVAAAVATAAAAVTDGRELRAWTACEEVALSRCAPGDEAAKCL